MSVVRKKYNISSVPHMVHLDKDLFFLTNVTDNFWNHEHCVLLKIVYND